VSAVHAGTASREGEAAPSRPHEERTPSSWVLQGVAASAGTILGEVLGASTTGKVVAGILGAWIGGFLTAPGRHHHRRIVAVSLLVALAAFLRNAASALAAGTRPTSSTASGAGSAGAGAALPASWSGVLVAAAIGFTLGSGAAALGTSFSGKGSLSDGPPPPRSAPVRAPRLPPSRPPAAPREAPKPDAPPGPSGAPPAPSGAPPAPSGAPPPEVPEAPLR
jgi:hypothetical protein